MEVKTVAIIGLQRVGASVGLAIKKAGLDLKVIGHDRNRATMKQAVDMGAVDETGLNLVAVARRGDIVILTELFSDTKDTMAAIGQDLQPHTVVIDFGPLKKPVQSWADDFFTNGYYVGVKPIMNAVQMQDMRTTIDAADADLFRNSVFCLMPNSTVSEDAVSTAKSIGIILGSEPFFIDSAEYDTYAQALETLPSLMAASLFRALASTTGWNDMRRIAGQPFTVATSGMQKEAETAKMAFEDKASTLHWIDTIVNHLLEMRRWVSDGDVESLSALLTQLNIQRDSWLHERNENNWTDVATPDIPKQGAMETLLGGYVARRFRRD